MKQPGLRVLFCRSNPIAPDPRVEKEAAALLQGGYAVSVIGWDRSAALPASERRDGLHIERISIQAPYAAGMMNLPNLLRWEYLLLSWLWRHRSEYDLIHACDFDTILPALWAKKFWGKRVVYDIFDFYADHLRRTPKMVKALIRASDIAAIGKADALILCDDARLEQILGAKPRRTAIIYNTPMDASMGKDETALSSPAGKLRLGYVGLIQVERGLFDILALLRERAEWSLVLAGFGGDEERVVAAAAAMPNVTWRGRVPYETALEIDRSADVLFALYDPAIPNHRYSSANKLFEAMMLGKPVLVAENSNMDRIVAKYDCGLVVPYGDRKAIEDALARLAGDPELRSRLGRNGRSAYETSYSWAVMAERLVMLYQGLAA